jgi:hypothetical protein
LARSGRLRQRKNIIISDLRTSNVSQGGIARKAPDRKNNKSGGAGGGVGGQAQSRSQAKVPALNIVNCLAPARGRSEAHADGPANPAGQSAHGQRHGPPHKAKKGVQGQSTCNTHGRLVKANPAFDQLLSKYASKKVVLHNRPTKKPWTKRSNKTARKVTQHASPIHPIMPTYFLPTYSSSMHYHVQM